MKKKKLASSKIVFWVLVVSVLLSSSVLIYELQKEGMIKNKYVALAKIIPSQQDRWLSLFIIHEIHDVLPQAEVDIQENPDEGGLWKVTIPAVSPQDRQALSNRMIAVFNVMSGFGFYGEKRTHNGTDFYLLFRELSPWLSLEVLTSPRYRVAIVIDDVGYNRNDAELFLNLPQKMTYAIFPHLPLSKSIGEKFHEQGKEVLIHLPMEALDKAQNQNEALLLRSGDSESRIRDIMKKAIDTLPSARGVNNHKGSKATQDLDLMKRLMKVLNENNLVFLDSLTSYKSHAYEAATELGTSSYIRDIFIDGSNSTEYITRKLRETIVIAKKKGFAIAIGHAKLSTYKALVAFFNSFDDPEIEFVSLTDIPSGQSNKKGNNP
jgi:hypothetical protein